ncbi:FAD-binding oxidoreductase [Falsochrobactrum sp. TDYN1]|uniref:FAD-binding oxidoreductase n=1 Tax=Falsochrobactrum tianjinense TaxID=2706015 RepID=A0A949PK41_9HYPH|nr:FAD-binding oxidoreductase [Falsochrobactrum sp. TDYN1]MBV2142507.1 FAD-binding oxidoreductase [Falsochrobactrum sp. TDYN1]
MLDKTLIERFSAIVGEKNALTAPDDIAPYLVEPRDLYQGRSALVLRPGSTEEVSAIMKLAHETGTSVVPQGGNTGLVGAQTPDESGATIVLALGRMNKIRSLDPVGNLVTVEAGVILKNLQDEAEKAGRLFPLSLGAEGSCQIGGNLGSNAGGTAVLAYGNMRELCLGLEVVLPDGKVLDDLRYLKKDNTGYDLKDLFIGSEGTLGIITAAVLKIFPQPKGKGVAYAGLKSPEDALRLFQLASEHAGPSLTGFELMPRMGVEFTVRHVDGARDPLESPHDWYVLIDISSARSEEDARTTLETILGEAFEADILQDAAIAESVAQAQSFWRMREEMSWAQKPEGGSIKHDISVPVASIPAFIREADKAVLEMIPGSRIVCFGHIGDGNLHYNISQPVDADKQAFLARWDEMNHRIHTIVASYGGSISAEHGIGRLKRDELVHFKQALALDLMRRIKSAFDPKGIMNPGKML